MRLKELIVALCIVLVGPLSAQNLKLDVGFGFGAANADGNTKDKGELTFTLLKEHKFGVFGLDVAFGGTLNPLGSDKISGLTVATFDVDPSENSYTSIALLYRYRLANILYVEPRIGYSSLGRDIDSNTGQTRVSRANLSMGMGVGKTLGRFTLAFRYQYLGRTASYQGINTVIIDNNTSSETHVRQSAASYGIFIFRVSYAIGLDNLFSKKSEKTEGL